MTVRKVGQVGQVGQVCEDTAKNGLCHSNVDTALLITVTHV